MSFGGLLVFFGKCLLQWSHQIWDSCVVSKPESLAISSPSKKQQLATFLWSTYWHHPIQFSYQVKKNGQPTAYLDSLSRLILTWWFGETIVLQGLGIRNSHPWTHTMDPWEFQSLQFQKSGREVPRRKRKNEASHLLLSCPTRQPRCREGGSEVQGFEGEVLASQGTNSKWLFCGWDNS